MVSYPYEANITRKSGFLSFQDHSVRATVKSNEPGDCYLSHEAMQVVLLQDLRDQLSMLNNKIDTLVAALNDNLEDELGE